VSELGAAYRPHHRGVIFWVQSKEDLSRKKIVLLPSGRLMIDFATFTTINISEGREGEGREENVLVARRLRPGEGL
jgi:hypothetical protein